jgi:hypothetical protein
MTDIAKVLIEHAKWLADRSTGKRADLRGVDLSGVDLSGADLRRANLRGVDLSGANLSGVDLRWADLRGANLSGANLDGADMTEANLSGANLSGADLTRVDLRGVNLCWANLDGANLRGVDLRYCIGDGEVIRTLSTRPWPWHIVCTVDTLAIGCQQHLITSWEVFTDKQISNMDNKALTWWLTNKTTVLSLVKGELLS